MNIDPEKIIKSAAPGTAIYARVHRPEPHTDFLVREESTVIKQLKNPPVALRTGLFLQNNIALVVVMFWIGSNPDQIFETWWNYHQTGDGHKHFGDMITQDNIAIHIYGDSGKVEKSIKINNSLKDFFKKALEKIYTLPAWLMDDFDTARDAIYKLYPNPGTLWRSLEK